MKSSPDMQNPSGRGGASRNQLAGWLQNPDSLNDEPRQAQNAITSDLGPYPHTPGSKGPDGTSQAAAEAIAPLAPALRSIALKAIAKLGSATPLEAIAITGLTERQLQPRFSELKEMGLIEATGERRQNPSGKSAAVLALTDLGRERLA